MTTITEKTSQSLSYLNAFDDAEGKLEHQGWLTLSCLFLEFNKLAALVRNDLLGFTKTIPVKKIASKW